MPRAHGRPALHPRTPDPLEEGLKQLDTYLSGLGVDSGWLIIFDRRPEAPPLQERLGSSIIVNPGSREVRLIRA